MWFWPCRNHTLGVSKIGLTESFFPPSSFSGKEQNPDSSISCSTSRHHNQLPWQNWDWNLWPHQFDLTAPYLFYAEFSTHATLPSLPKTHLASASHQGPTTVARVAMVVLLGSAEGQIQGSWASNCQKYTPKKVHVPLKRRHVKNGRACLPATIFWGTC